MFKSITLVLAVLLLSNVAEVGQALYYAAKTGRTAGVVLIIEKDADRKHLPKIRVLAEKYKIRIWEMVPADVE